MFALAPDSDRAARSLAHVIEHEQGQLPLATGARGARGIVGQAQHREPLAIA